MIAETASLAKQAQAQRDLDIQKAQFTEQSRKQEAQADKAYEIQTNVMQQQVIAEQVKIQQIEKEQKIKVQEPEIVRHEKELIATVLKQAEIERQCIENIAAAERSRLTIEAEGRASSIRTQGQSEASLSIPERLGRQAKAMNVEAAAYQEWYLRLWLSSFCLNIPSMPQNCLGAMLLHRSPMSTRSRSLSTGNEGNRPAEAGTVRRTPRRDCGPGARAFVALLWDQNPQGPDGHIKGDEAAGGGHKVSEIAAQRTKSGAPRSGFSDMGQLPRTN